MLKRKTLASNAEVRYDKAFGALIGLAIGDSFGDQARSPENQMAYGIMPPYSGSDNSHHWTDGAAMRVAPIGVVCAGDPERAARLAEMDACVSHYRDGVWGAQAVAASVAVAMVDGTVEEIVEAGLRFIPKDSWLGRWMAKSMTIVDEAGTLERAWDRLHRDLWTFIRCSNAEALSQTYALFRLTGGDFVDGVIYAGNFGRDADTLAALVGALSGAKHGAQAIPADWIDMKPTIASTTVTVVSTPNGSGRTPPPAGETHPAASARTGRMQRKSVPRRTSAMPTTTSSWRRRGRDSTSAATWT